MFPFHIHTFGPWRQILHELVNTSAPYRGLVLLLDGAPAKRDLAPLDHLQEVVHALGRRAVSEDGVPHLHFHLIPRCRDDEKGFGGLGTAEKRSN